MEEWTRVDGVVALEAEEVQVWRASALQAEAVMEACWARLSAEEVKRAGRTRAGFARDEFVVGRALLRALLGKALGCEAKEVVLGAGEHGKPRVDGVEFNVSHSRGMVLVALCRKAAVGVDVEGIDAGIEALEIARGAFAAEEYARIAAAPDAPERVRAFYSIWTQKEALTKAHGDGLMLGLAGFSVAEGAGRVRLLTEGGAGETWYAVQPLALGESFAAALAVQGEERAVRRLEISSAGLMGAMR